MAIAFRANSRANSFAAATTFTVPKPTGLVAGDVLIAFYAYSQGFPFSDMTATEFTQTGGDAPTTNNVNKARAFIRTAGNSEPANYTFGRANNTGALSILIMAAFSGVDNVNPLDAALVWQTNAGSLTNTAPSVSPSGSGSLLLCTFSGRQASATSYTYSGSLIERAFDTQNYTAPTGMASEQLSVGGASGTRTGTSNGSAVAADGSVCFSLTLQPATPPPQPLQWPARNFAATY